MNVKSIEPWKIQITKVNLADSVDLEGIANEIHALHCASPRDSAAPYAVTPEEFPLICALRDGVITKAVEAYCMESFGIIPEDLTIDTFGKWFEKGKNLGPHLHGNSCVTSVFYPFDYESGMTLHDPRFNACRGYSRRIRDTHFGDVYVNPKAGDLWIMPSYVMHNVPPVTEDLRVSLINDFHFV
jgi:hypothetical protein